MAGFVKTEQDLKLPLRTRVPGVFAIGGVRAGSVKRVGGAIGEAPPSWRVHAYLSERARNGRSVRCRHVQLAGIGRRA